jgi:hypothetical protein
MELARPFGQRSDDLDLRQTFAFTPSRCACRHCVTQQNDKQETGLHSDPGLAKALTPRHLGQPIERHEDAALLTGRGRFADDLGDAPGTLQAAVLRSPHAHADLLSVDATAALAMPGVRAV